MYARTNIELYLELIHHGYAEADLARISRCYEFACELFTCVYHRNGDTFLNHLVRTASILSCLQISPDIVVAGLLHSAYTHGNFGTWKRGMTNSKRAQLRSITGDVAENYIARYTVLDWSWHEIPDLQKRLKELSKADGTAVLLRLVNELEEFLDFGIFYCANAEERLKGMEYFRSAFVAMAMELGFPSLASELERVFRETEQAKVPLFLRSKHLVFYTINPHTLSVDRLPLLWDSAVRKFQLMRSHVRLRTRLRHLIHSMRSSQTAKT